jgi:hypothetical protein
MMVSQRQPFSLVIDVAPGSRKMKVVQCIFLFGSRGELPPATLQAGPWEEAVVGAATSGRPRRRRRRPRAVIFTSRLTCTRKMKHAHMRAPCLRPESLFFGRQLAGRPHACPDPTNCSLVHSPSPILCAPNFEWKIVFV